MRPGRVVTATASRSATAMPARSSACSTMGTIVATCALHAISGTTPPYLAWRCSWDATTLARVRVPSATTAAAVSSQEVSMPRMRMGDATLWAAARAAATSCRP